MLKYTSILEPKEAFYSITCSGITITNLKFVSFISKILLLLSFCSNYNMQSTIFSIKSKHKHCKM